MAKAYHGADTRLIGDVLRSLAETSVQAATALTEWEKLPFDKLNDDEPWFFFRSRDELAPRTLDYYAGLLRARDRDDLADEVDGLGAAMVSWQIRMPEVVRLPT